MLDNRIYYKDSYRVNLAEDHRSLIFNFLKSIIKVLDKSQRTDAGLKWFYRVHSNGLLDAAILNQIWETKGSEWEGWKDESY